MANAALTADGRARVLADGHELPLLGLGVWQVRPGGEAESAVRWALELGYRHIDTAQAYENEDRAGAAMERSGVERESVFLTTKLAAASLRRDRVGPATDDSLRRLRTDYVDLLLIHWPNSEVPMAETLAAMEELEEAGKVRHVGVSNFPRSLLEEAMRAANIFCDQVEYHPFLGQRKLRALASEHDLLLTAYSPLAQGKVAGDATLVEIAEAHGATAAQVALRWLIEQDKVAAIPKATSAERIEENLGALEVELSEEELRRIDGLERGERLIDPDFAPDWED